MHLEQDELKYTAMAEEESSCSQNAVPVENVCENIESKERLSRSNAIENKETELKAAKRTTNRTKNLGMKNDQKHVGQKKCTSRRNFKAIDSKSKLRDVQRPKCKLRSNFRIVFKATNKRKKKVNNRKVNTKSVPKNRCSKSTSNEENKSIKVKAKPNRKRKRQDSLSSLDKDTKVGDESQFTDNQGIGYKSSSKKEGDNLGSCDNGYLRRISQEFPRHNWLENKYYQKSATVECENQPGRANNIGMTKKEEQEHCSSSVTFRNNRPMKHTEPGCERKTENKVGNAHREDIHKSATQNDHKWKDETEKNQLESKSLCSKVTGNQVITGNKCMGSKHVNAFTNLTTAFQTKTNNTTSESNVSLPIGNVPKRCEIDKLEHKIDKEIINTTNVPISCFQSTATTVSGSQAYSSFQYAPSTYTIHPVPMESDLTDATHRCSNVAQYSSTSNILLTADSRIHTANNKTGNMIPVTKSSGLCGGQQTDMGKEIIPVEHTQSIRFDNIKTPVTNVNVSKRQRVNAETKKRESRNNKQPEVEAKLRERKYLLELKQQTLLEIERLRKLAREENIIPPEEKDSSVQKQKDSVGTEVLQDACETHPLNPLPAHRGFRENTADILEKLDNLCGIDNTPILMSASNKSHQPIRAHSKMPSSSTITKCKSPLPSHIITPRSLNKNTEGSVPTIASAQTSKNYNSNSMSKSLSTDLSPLTASSFTPSLTEIASKSTASKSVGIVSTVTTTTNEIPIVVNNTDIAEVQSTVKSVQTMQYAEGNVTLRSSDQTTKVDQSKALLSSSITKQPPNDGTTLHKNESTYIILDDRQENESLVKDGIDTGVTKSNFTSGQTGAEVSPLLQYAQSNIIQTNVMVSNVKCSVCFKFAYFLCSNCHAYWYCSPECQIKHWNVHQTECKSVSHVTAPQK